ncbi:hypothetical protein AB0N92_35250 [Streptomyces sp. NPDC093248]|uniref:hypothetical protein n=1 Tax=Streptomyces sp. NPDC093248 TaxID=3155072 RepID=UPI00342AC03F
MTLAAPPDSAARRARPPWKPSTRYRAEVAAAHHGPRGRGKSTKTRTTTTTTTTTTTEGQDKFHVHDQNIARNNPVNQP